MGNIFDELAQEGKKPHKKKKNPPTKPPISSIKYSDADAELAAMFQRINEIKGQISQQLTVLHEEAKRAHVDVNAFIQARSHLFANDFDKIKEIQQKIASFKPKSFQPNSTDANSSTYGTVSDIPEEKSNTKSQNKSQEQLTQERKGKTRGVRKKWIPMK